MKSTFPNENLNMKIQPPSLSNHKENFKNKNLQSDDDEMLKMFILKHLPEPIRILIEDGKMPSYIEEAIFSRTYNKSEIVKLIVGNDEVLRALLPKKTQLLLQVISFHLSIRPTIFHSEPFADYQS